VHEIRKAMYKTVRNAPFTKLNAKHQLADLDPYDICRAMKAANSVGKMRWMVGILLKSPADNVLP
jgi:hypothetical protein